MQGDCKRDTAKRVETMSKCSTHGLVGVAKRGGVWPETHPSIH